MSKKSRESAGRETPGREARAQLMSAVESLSGSVGVRRACELLGVSRASWYRARQTRATARARPRPPLALRPHEQEEALAVLHAERFVDQAPRTIYATLLEEGRYLASVRTLYRLLASRSEVRERRAQRRHPNYSRPELLATAPNQLWSWDITRLKGPPAEGSREVDLFPPVCDPGCFQPLRRRLDGRSSGVVTVGRAAHPAHLQKSQHPLRATDSARRPRLLDEVQARRAAARRSRGHQDPFPPARLRRQSLLGGPVQDLEIPPGLPRAIRLHRRRPRPLRGFLPLVQPRTPALRHRPVHSRRRSPQPRSAASPDPTGHPG